MRHININKTRPILNLVTFSPDSKETFFLSLYDLNRNILLLPTIHRFKYCLYKSYSALICKNPLIEYPMILYYSYYFLHQKLYSLAKLRLFFVKETDMKAKTRCQIFTHLVHWKEL